MDGYICRFRHLCNNSVQKHSTAYDAAEVAVQSMWSSTRFSEYLGYGWVVELGCVKVGGWCGT